MDALVGRVAFIFDGNVVSGWPLVGEFAPPEATAYGQLWEADSDVGHTRPFANVTHWIEFPRAIWEIELGATR